MDNPAAVHGGGNASSAAEPIFARIFGASWASLPPALRKHYANRPFTRDVVVVDGRMSVETSWLIWLLGPLLRLSGALVPTAGDDIPVTVTFRSEPGSDAFCLDRAFRFAGRPPYQFRSRMVPAEGNAVIEWMPVGIGWHAGYAFENDQVRLDHRGYVARVFGAHVPLPLHWVLGRGEACEQALDDDTFRMAMSLQHPLFGKVYGYSGTFRIREVRLDR